MLKNNKGITLMSLVITIVIMVVLISIVGYFSLDSIKNSYIANQKKELADVVQYVGSRKTKMLLDEFDVSEKFDGTVLTSEGLYLVAKGLLETDKNTILEVNASEYITDNQKYLYITADKLNAESLVTDGVVVKDVKNNYIINFFTGTIIGIYENGERVEISGQVKNLPTIMAEMN